MTKKQKNSPHLNQPEDMSFEQLNKTSVINILQQLANDNKMTLKDYSYFLKTTNKVDNNIIIGRSYFDIYYSLE